MVKKTLYIKIFQLLGVSIHLMRDQNIFLYIKEDKDTLSFIPENKSLFNSDSKSCCQKLRTIISFITQDLSPRFNFYEFLFHFIYF